MTIYKYHYGASITVGTDYSGAFSVDISGDGIDETPVYEIANRIEETISTLSEKFPSAAFNVGLNFGFTGSGIGEPETLSDEDKSILRDYAASLDIGEPIPAPAGTYEATISGISQNADGSTSIDFRVEDLDTKGAATIRELKGQRFPFNLAAAIYDAPVPDSYGEKTPEDIAKDQERQRREKRADEFDARNRTARDAMASLEPVQGRDQGVDIVALEEAARRMTALTGVHYERCLAIMVSMIKVERFHHG